MKHFITILLLIPTLTYSQLDKKLNVLANDLVYLYQQANLYSKSHTIKTVKFINNSDSIWWKDVSSFSGIGKEIHQSKSPIKKVIINSNYVIDVKNNELDFDTETFDFANHHLNYLVKRPITAPLTHNQLKMDFDERLDYFIDFSGFVAENISCETKNRNDSDFDVVKDAYATFFRYKNSSLHWLSLLDNTNNYISTYLKEGKDNQVFVLVVMSSDKVKKIKHIALK